MTDALAARWRGCRADCAFWAGDEVEYRNRRSGASGSATGIVLGPFDLDWPQLGESPGEQALREALAAATVGQTRVMVSWRDAPAALGAGNVIDTARLRHHGPCPPVFRPGSTARVASLVAGNLNPGDVVRVTGIAPSGILTIQAADGRHAESYRRQLVPLSI